MHFFRLVFDDVDGVFSAFGNDVYAGWRYQYAAALSWASSAAASRRGDTQLEMEDPAWPSSLSLIRCKTINHGCV